MTRCHTQSRPCPIRILLTEKTRGLSIASADGKRSELIRGTPKAYHEGFEMPGVQLFMGGYILELALHPDYAKNGWIYLSYTDRCTDCNAASRKSRRPVSMNALVRGRIKNGEWIDQQTIWHTDVENYTGMPDMIRRCPGSSPPPYGKILRLNDDSTIPADNPFAHTSDALAAIWTYGHRSPEGLEFDRKTGQLWETRWGNAEGTESIC